MSEQLLIRLASQAEQAIHWMLWSDSEQEIIASGALAHADDLASLQERVNVRNAVAVVPSADISLRKVETPARPSRQFIQALPYMLEEDLASDVDELFFAPGSRSQKAELHYMQVAAVSQQKMQNWLAWLEQAGIKCQKILPDCLLLPYQENSISVLQVGDDWLIRHAEFDGVSCQTEELEFWLTLLAKECANSRSANTEESAEISIVHYSPLPENINLQPYTCQAGDYLPPLQILIAELNKQTFNLRQGQFQFKKDSSQFVKIWRNAAIIAAVALSVNIANKAVTVYQLQAQADALDAQIKQAYVSVFPNGRNLSSTMIQKQLKSKLKTSGGSSDQISFLALIEASAVAFSQVPDLKPENIRFDIKRGEIRLNASASNFQSFEKFRAAAEQNQLQVEQGSLNNQGSQVVGAISIRSV
ncbi:type II secretion system protein GspL [Catenovulum sediminis]|uniref:Type II secretion system protein L n=1 Tax=Catenovulum sediminis TaxID=1740262 RepID=A0ABV1RHP8_9ALTE